MNLQSIKAYLWKRHANPWSVWTRLLSAPLSYAPFWNRSWKQGIAVAGWFAVNPFLFPEPKNKKNWSAQAIRGEQQWARERPLDISFAIQTTGAAAFLGGFYFAYQRKLWPTVASAVAVIASNAWFLDRMTKYHSTKERSLFNGELCSLFDLVLRWARTVRENRR